MGKLGKALQIIGLCAVLAIVGTQCSKRNPRQPGIINPSNIPTHLPGVEIKKK